MDYKQDKRRMNIEDDRLSNLPDDLIHKILSFISIREAIGTSKLSSRWRFMWTSMPCLDFTGREFTRRDFSTLSKYSNFVTQALSRRNNLVEVFSIKMYFCGDISQDYFKKFVNYAFSHNIQQLNIVFLLENQNIEFPLSVFSSQSLKHLTLTREFLVLWSNNIDFWGRELKTTSTWELPALTTLHLHHITLCDDNDEITEKGNGLFSKCANLTSLALTDCKMTGSNNLCISHPLLSTLAIDNFHHSGNFTPLVDAPQLKNLTIGFNYISRVHYLISAPKLASLMYEGSHPLLLSTNGLHSLEKADIHVSYPEDADATGFVRLFQELRSVKFLRLNLEILELLSSCVELISDHPSPFTNLKMLKIYPSSCKEQKKVEVSTDVFSYLLDSSPGAKMTMVSREEIRDMQNTKLAQRLMTNFRLLLYQAKAEMETNRAHMEKEKVPMQSHNTKIHEQGKTQCENLKHIEERMTSRINGCWKDLSVRIEQGKRKTAKIFSDLQEIKEVLIKLPMSKRAELQKCFSSLCVEADEVVNNILDQMKIHCDMKGNRFSMYFHEMASM